MKGLCQGNPLSPMLLNIVVDMLAILIAGAKEDGRVGGLLPHLVEGGVSILQYANDTILFICGLTPLRLFTVKCIYVDFMRSYWVSMEIPLKIKGTTKIKVFMWFLNMLTNDNLLKRHRIRCEKCVFCDAHESIDRLFID
jgi:hypothetical protein